VQAVTALTSSAVQVHNVIVLMTFYVLIAAHNVQSITFRRKWYYPISLLFRRRTRRRHTNRLRGEENRGERHSAECCQGAYFTGRRTRRGLTRFSGTYCAASSSAASFCLVVPSAAPTWETRIRGPSPRPVSPARYPHINTYHIRVLYE